MKKIYAIIAFLGLGFSAFAQIDYRPKIERIKGVPIVCPAGTGESNTYIPPPAVIAHAIKNKLRLPAKSQFIVSYKGFPDAAKKSFQEAIDIWSGLITSPVPIRVDAVFEKLDNGVLGAASPASFDINFNGAQKAFTWYPIALAEKMAQRELNGDEPDIEARFNRDVNWYLSSTGAPGTGQFDFTSVVLHEIGHGLGFTGSLRPTTSAATSFGWGYGTGNPLIFDTFIENGAGLLLTNEDSFENPSPKLGDEVKSDNLFFNSPIATKRNNGEKPRLYAPTTYSGGSSVYHLNSDTYPSGTINSLMTPTANTREVIKDPGPLTLNMFAEMGWVGTSVLHNRLPDKEDVVNPIRFSTNIISDTTLIANSAKLVYSINDSLNRNPITVDLSRVGNTDEYFYNLLPAANGEDRTIRYYFEVKDNSGRTFTNPPQAPRYRWAFKNGIDKEAPEIDHFPIDLVFAGDTVLVEAGMFDNLGIDTAYVEYSINGSSRSSLPLLISRNGIYRTQFPLADIVPGNVFRYRIVAIDEAKGKNRATFPATNNQFLEFTVVRINAIRSVYENNFNTASSDFAGAFSITQPAGFDNPAIHSDHPYKNGTGPGFQSNFTHTLLTPIRIKNDPDSAIIRFDEVVLVEPGEAGAAFGTTDFYDYVIVEGSNNGVDWIPFANGYDSRNDKLWLDAFNSQSQPDPANAQVPNSTATGNKNLFLPREINMLRNGRFKGGDVVLIRFRLFTDQLSWGWGWAIDNLKIQTPPPPIITSTEPKGDPDFSIGPNPAPEEVTIRTKLAKPGLVRIEVVNMLGAKVILKEVNSPTVAFQHKINTTELSNGTYILKVYQDNNLTWRRFVVQH